MVLRVWTTVETIPLSCSDRYHSLSVSRDSGGNSVQAVTQSEVQVVFV